jgi:acetyl esterase/lipase
VLSQYSPADIVLIGRSAGGNLALAMLLRGRDEGLPMPAELVLLSPEIDLTESGDSFHANRHVDVMLPLPYIPINRLYAGDADLGHPYLSPLFGQLEGLRHLTADGYPRPLPVQCGAPASPVTPG